MELKDDAIFLRQVSTKQDKKNDAKKGRFVSQFSRTKEWSKSMSDTFFKRTNNRMTNRMSVDHRLIKVIPLLFV